LRPPLDISLQRRGRATTETHWPARGEVAGFFARQWGKVSNFAGRRVESTTTPVQQIAFAGARAAPVPARSIAVHSRMAPVRVFRISERLGYRTLNRAK
jgi:hypothetical protein